MDFNNSTNKEDSLLHYTLFLLGLDSADTTSYPIADFTRSANSWTRNGVFTIWKNTSTWEFDDSNYTTFPIGTADLVDLQQDYALPTNALEVQRVEILDANGDYQILKQFDKAQVENQSLTEFYETAGMPAYYDIIGSAIFLYPKPATASVTLTDGLKVYLSRDIDEFTVADTTQNPGFFATFHPYVAYGAALDYAIAKNMDVNRVNILNMGLAKYEDAMKTYYAKRNQKDLKVRIKPSTSSSV
jgi:hypothetical protein